MFLLEVHSDAVLKFKVKRLPNTLTFFILFADVDVL